MFESDDRFGGKILSGEFRGRPVDFGPDNFLTRNASAAELCDQLGLGDDSWLQRRAPPRWWRGDGCARYRQGSSSVCLPTSSPSPGHGS